MGPASKITAIPKKTKVKINRTGRTARSALPDSPAAIYRIMGTNCATKIMRVAVIAIPQPNDVTDIFMLYQYPHLLPSFKRATDGELIRVVHLSPYREPEPNPRHRGRELLEHLR